jgi:LPS export ABC transporter protein LptC
MKSVFAILPLLMILLIFSCEKPEELKEIQEYKGPLKEAEDIELYYMELTKVKTKVEAQVVWEYQNGDREFPEGIFLQFYDDDGNVTSKLRADKAFYTKKENLWRGLGDVEVKNLEKGQQLNTEELFWKPDQEKIFTEKFVTIKEGDQVLYGTGLEAKQDFSSWFIKNVEGEFYLDEEKE